MSLIYKIFLLLNLFLFISYAQTTISLTSSSEMEKLISNQDTKFDTVNLYINSIKFFDSFEERIKPLLEKWENLSSIKSLAFLNIDEINGTFLTWILSTIPENQLSSLTLCHHGIAL